MLHEAHLPHALVAGDGELLGANLHGPAEHTAAVGEPVVVVHTSDAFAASLDSRETFGVERGVGVVIPAILCREPGVDQRARGGGVCWRGLSGRRLLALLALLAVLALSALLSPLSLLALLRRRGLVNLRGHRALRDRIGLTSTAGDDGEGDSGEAREGRKRGRAPWKHPPTLPGIAPAQIPPCAPSPTARSSAPAVRVAQTGYYAKLRLPRLIETCRGRPARGENPLFRRHPPP